MLLLIERSRDPVVRPCRIQNLLQLHSVHDLVFVTELVRVHRMNITIETSHWKTKRWSTMQQVQPPLKVPAQPLPQTPFTRSTYIRNSVSSLSTTCYRVGRIGIVVATP
ncbi:hypothetical protein BASA83_003238 [Batrachochytrium salamandrivorans]|nr:hypothetical protein BASA83_003238 [Batrachochytrium salamandrivorans]